ncbi:MAG: cytochrome c3 family protein [Magnetococcales bacterium]|nr:cytochrome c3 family protein [Magnetococcales bacterium]
MAEGRPASSYERPTRTWVCGRSLEGRACRAEPDARGNCPGRRECHPVQRQDRWYCARPQSAGGPCAEGPAPDGTCGRPRQYCHPLRHLTVWRKIWTRWALIVACGVVLAVTYGDRVLNYVSPGPLSPAHSSIEKCATCHAAARQGPRGWLRLATGAQDPLPDNMRCLQCHPLGQAPQAPHSLDPPELKKLSRAAGEVERESPLVLSVHGAARVLTPDLGLEKPLACGLCHLEHQGASPRTSWWAEDRCNACHQRPTVRFSQDHPRFIGYPHQVQTSIKFDHRSHFMKHFLAPGQKNVPGDCLACHPSNGMGNLLASIRFKPACGGCHADQIREMFRSGPRGLPILSLPGLDLDTLRTRRVDIGEWPEGADGEISPFMTVFFAGFPGFQEATVALKGLDTTDLSRATPEQLAAVKTVAWGIKEFFHDLLTLGRPGLARRLRFFLGERPGASDLGQLTGHLPADLIWAVQVDWFPELAREMALHKAGQPVPVPLPGAREDWPADGDFGWLLGTPPSPPAVPVADEPEGGDLLDGADGLLAGDAGEPLTTRTTGTGSGVIPPLASEAPPPAVTADAWIEGGGWYREGYSLYYLPTGHEDGFLEAWLDQLYDRRQRSSEARGLFELLTRSEAAGQCGKCHFGTQTPRPTGESLPREQAVIAQQPGRWHGRLVPLNSKAFKKFHHRSHLSLVADCAVCHPFNPAAPVPGQNGLVTSGFAQLNKKVCADCHRPGRAGDTCLQCHNYHVGANPGLLLPPGGSAGKTGGAPSGFNIGP